jgi:hypothetical protein
MLLSDYYHRDPENQSGCVYEDQLFTNKVMAAIENRSRSDNPFFIFWAPRVVHSPLQVPQPQLDHFAFIDDRYGILQTVQNTANYGV